MFRSRVVILHLSLLLLLTPMMLSCSSDDPVQPDPGTPTGTGDTARTQATIDALAPILQQTYLGSYLTTLAAVPFPTSGPAQCQPIADGCETGSLEFCPSAEGGVVNFGSCVNSGVTADGAITVVGNALAGTATLDLTINGVAILGDIAYEFDTESNCLIEYFQDVSATVNGMNLTLSASLEYCLTGIEEGPIVPTGGTLLALVEQAELKLIYVDITFLAEEARGSIYITVSDPSFIQIYLACTGNILTRHLDCFVPEMG